MSLKVSFVSPNVYYSIVSSRVWTPFPTGTSLLLGVPSGFSLNRSPPPHFSPYND